jgi:hypothetical protein
MKNLERMDSLSLSLTRAYFYVKVDRFCSKIKMLKWIDAKLTYKGVLVVFGF